MASEERGKKIALAVGATALVAGGVSLGLHYLSRPAVAASGGKADAHISCVLLLDTGGASAPPGRTVRHPRRGPISDLIALAGALFNLDTPRLFLESTREELLPEVPSVEALEAASGSTNKLVVVIVTPGAPLSDAVASLPPLQPPPYGPKPLPLIGNALLLTGPYEPPMYNVWHKVFTPEKIAQWGDTVRLVIKAPTRSSHGGDPLGAGGWDDVTAVEETIFTCSPEVAAELLDRQDDFPKTFNRPLQKKLQEFASNGIFTCDTFDPDWAPSHGLLPRFFNVLKIKGYYPAILDKTRIFVREWAKMAGDAGPEGVLVPHINDWFACMTADAVVKCAIGVDMRNVERKASGTSLHPFIRVFRDGIAAATGRLDLRQQMGAAYYCPFISKQQALDKALVEARKEAEEMVSDMVERTRRGEIGTDGNSVIAAMLNDKAPNTGEFVRLQAIYGHVINLMVAGHETTATTLAWTLYYLAQHPEYEARAYKEIKEVLNGAAEPTADDITKLVFVEACFREALRLHPPVTNVSRDAASDTIIQGKWLVRRGQRINVNLVAMHRREDQWGGGFGDVNKFNPDRFMPGTQEAAGLLPRHPQAFLPWGFGVRACIGQLFALWEAKTFLAMVLLRFKLRTPPGYKPRESNQEGGATPLPLNLAFHVHMRPNAPPVPAPEESAAAAAAPAAAAAAPAAAAAAAAPAGAASHGTPLLVLWGSNSGMCDDFAHQVADAARATGFAVTATTLDTAIAGGKTLPTTGAVAIVSSSYNGNAPDNAAAFDKWAATVAPGSLAGVRVSVFGVGNSQWAATYQAFPKRIDAAMQKGGATLLLPLATVDVDQAGLTDTFDEWKDGLVSALLSSFQVASAAGAAAPAPAALRVVLEEPSAAAPADLEIADAPCLPAAAMLAMRKRMHEGARADLGYHPLEVLVSEELLPADSARKTRHVELALPAGVEYQAGDHLEVLPMNSPSLVKAALFVLGLTGTERFVWVAGDREGAARGIGAVGSPNLPVGSRLGGMRVSVPAALLLAYLGDLSAVPTRKALAQLSEAARDPSEAAALRALASEDAYASKVAGPKVTIIELLMQYKSVKVTISDLLNVLPRLAPRYYSISSSPLADPRRCSITVGLVQYTTATGRAHRGASSGMIHSMPVGQAVVGTVRVLQSTFKLPKDPSVPIIMVGPGTGLAPMMGFMQERDALLSANKKTALGEALLFFGCRSSLEDYIYKDRLEGYLSRGVLTGLHVAFSRDGPSKVYVQDLIEQQGAKVWELLEAGAYIYICGDARRMAPDVRKAFTSVARAHGGRSEASAQNWMGALQEAGRYLEDVWAG